MSTQWDDPTMPVQHSRGEGSLGGDQTVPATRVGGPGGPTGRRPGNGEGWNGGGDDGDRRKMWWIIGGVLAAGILVGVLIALLAGGDDSGTSRSSTTSSSTTTSSTTSSTTTTTSAPTTTTGSPAPQILQFSTPSGSPPCQPGTQITLTWSTQNAVNVTISIDNPNGPYGDYNPTGSTQVPFACPPVSHVYYLTANGSAGRTTQKSIVVQSQPAPSSTTTTTQP